MTSPSTSRRAAWAIGSLITGYVLIGVVAGAPDSPLVPRLPGGVRKPVWTTATARWIGLDRLSRTGLTVVSILLLAALLAVFALLLVEAWRGRVRAAVVMAAAAISVAVTVAAPVLLSRDVYSYAAYGRIYAVHHSNPYLLPPSDFPADPFVKVASPAWIDTRAVYGPAFVLAGGAVARVWEGSTGATILAFKVLAGVGAALATLLAALAARSDRGRSRTDQGGSPPDRSAFAAVAVGLNPVIVVHTVGGGHNDALIAACLAGALALALRWTNHPERLVAHQIQPIAVTALLTLAVLIKVVLAPVLLVSLWSLLRAFGRGRRAASASVHVAVVLVLAVGFSAPFLTSARALTSLVTLTSVEGWASGARLVARGARAVGNGVGGSNTAGVLAKIVIIGFLGTFAVGFVRILRRGPIDRPADAWGASILGFALAIPYLLPWYAAWFIPFLALMSDRGLALIGFAAAGLLALTGVPAEPGSAPGLWRDMILGVHYGVGAVMLGLFLAWLRRVVAPHSLGGTEGETDPRMADRARP